MSSRFVTLAIIGLMLLPAAAHAAELSALDKLALRYAEGRGVRQDYAKAAGYLHQSAVDGDAVAQDNLAYFYTQGLGVKRDYARAAAWYDKAAAQGSADAQYHLGMLSYLGLGVPKNRDTAMNWFHQAAAQGHQTAAYDLELISARPASQSALESLGNGTELSPEAALFLTFLQGEGGAEAADAAYWLMSAM